MSHQQFSVFFTERGVIGGSFELPIQFSDRFWAFQEGDSPVERYMPKSCQTCRSMLKFAWNCTVVCGRETHSGQLGKLILNFCIGMYNCRFQGDFTDGQEQHSRQPCRDYTLLMRTDSYTHVELGVHRDSNTRSVLLWT